MATERHYTVKGMTCGHCRASVIEEVSGIEAVEQAEVDLASGRLDVRGEGFSDEQVKSAVEEAGYELAGAGR